MEDHQLTADCIAAFGRHLVQEERAAATVEKYLRDVGEFAAWLNGGAVTKEALLDWKGHLLAQSLAPSTVNGKLSAVNSLCRFQDWGECRVKFLKVQRQVFREPRRELTREEYLRLLGTARSTGQKRLELLMEAICSTGIRVSEVRYLTVEAAQAGQAVVQLKGKIRTILLPGKLCRKLLKYVQKQKITSGEIFLTRGGRSLSRTQIWREMKTLCRRAEIEPSKVFPHNLRHLFATRFYRLCRDIVKLADVLGHSSVETTRIYLLTTGAEHMRYLEKLQLIC